MILNISKFAITLSILILSFPPVSTPAQQSLKVASSPTEICPIPVGSQIPNLILRDLDGAAFDLNQSISKTPTILIIYRGGW